MASHAVRGDTTLFNALQAMQPYKSSRFLTGLERFFQQWSRRALWVAVAGLGVMMLLGAVRFLAGPLPPVLKTTGLILGLLDLIAWYVMLLADAAATFAQLAIRTVRDHHDRGHFAHDLDLASSIREYPRASIARADAWLDQEATGMERRVSVLFGKELAMVTLLTTLLTGKANEIGSAVVAHLAPTFHTTPGMVTGALCTAFVLLLIGAFRVKARVGRIAYLRYLIRLAGLGDDNSNDSANGMTALDVPSPAQVISLADHRAG
ncbi:hypothetical protein L2Y96_13000 [Luteibacter aegosomaticola]|uniref:hypothetical protein n=1 Tax=Luteibacter aegosomaticola TaxID=2911538 RepID=UPI001FF960A2|nr:hypothetical protein [Luteibacter aegosomaticola]UPG88338.1 hypothetical protein L2Y96_13000 [Luteibacter aegosomaticola]